MSVYPNIVPDKTTENTPSATIPFVHSTKQLMLATEFETGVESRRLLWDSVRRDVKINYSAMEFDRSNVLRRFYEEMKGPFKSFAFFFPQVEDYVDELVGVLRDTGGHPTPLLSIKLPSKGAQSYTLKRDGTSLTETTEYIFTSGGGPDGEDKVQFTASYTPVVGDIYTFSFTGNLKIKARFDGPIAFSDTKKYTSSASVTLKGLEPDLEI
jgi:hypothetical protein